jgi:hypothetical protein
VRIPKRTPASLLRIKANAAPAALLAFLLFSPQQDEDVLDTWFSSGLFPFSGGWLAGLGGLGGLERWESRLDGLGIKIASKGRCL